MTSLGLGSFALNDIHQVVFVALLADGRQEIIRATPVPEPAAVVAACVMAWGAMAAARRGEIGARCSIDW